MTSGKYTMKNAVVDLGFIDGLIRTNTPTDIDLWEPIMTVLDRIELSVNEERIPPLPTIYDLGFLRGCLWLRPMPGAYSETMDRLIEFFVEGSVDWYQLPRPWRSREGNDSVASDEQRDDINGAYACEGSEVAAEETGLPADEVERIVHPACRREHLKYRVADETREVDAATVAPASAEPSPSVSAPDQADRLDNEVTAATIESKLSGDGSSSSDTENATEQHHETCVVVVKPDVFDMLATAPAPTEPPASNPFNPSGKRGGRGWTPEQRAAHAEVTREVWRNRKPLISDDQLEDVKRDFEAGIPFDAIGLKYRCSGSHVRNFLTRHGIDPRRGRNVGVSKVHEETQTEAVETNVACETVPAPTPAADLKPSSIDPSEWPDIRQMLADGRSLEAIAGDYDVYVSDLEDFIEEREKQSRGQRVVLAEAKSPSGESLALSASHAGSAE